MPRFYGTFGATQDHLSRIEHAGEHLQRAVDNTGIGRYPPAIDEALVSMVLFQGVYELIPADWIRGRMNEADLVMNMATAYSHASKGFPRYAPALRSAKRALETARKLPDGYRGIGASREVYVDVLGRFVGSTRMAMGLREERVRDIQGRMGTVIGPDGDNDNLFTVDEWNDVVDAYVELDLAMRKRKNRNRIERLRLEIADMTANLV